MLKNKVICLSLSEFFVLYIQLSTETVSVIFFCLSFFPDVDTFYSDNTSAGFSLRKTNKKT